MFAVADVLLHCPWCATPVARLEHRTWPPRLEVRDLAGSPLPGERAGRVLQRIDSGSERLVGVRVEHQAVRDRLAREAIEVVYELTCPRCGRFWTTAPALAAEARRRGRGEPRALRAPAV